MHTIANRAEWMAERAALLADEKAFTRERDALSAKHRAMSWLKIETDYVFDGPDGPESLSDLFDGLGQLIVYHFIFAPEQDYGCKSCSFWADQFDCALPHLRARYGVRGDLVRAA